MTDLRYALRMLLKSPGFTAVAVLTLALGIGANTAVFTLINTLMLGTLSGVGNPHQLVLVTDRGHDCLSYALYERLCAGNQSLSGLTAAAWPDRRRMRITGSGNVEAEPVVTQAVAGNFFSILDAPATLGRVLIPDDDRPGNPLAVAVMSHAFWQRRFSLDPSVIGKTIRLGETALTIIGVARPEFSGWMVESRPDLWWPIRLIPQVDGADQADNFTNPTAQWVQIAGRLRPGVTQAQARTELDVLHQRMLTEQVDKYAASATDRQRFLEHRIELQAGGGGFSDVRGESRRPLGILLAITGLVLVVTCTNLAGLLLVRGLARQREFSVRAALGADRLTLMRQLEVESLLLAAVGGALGFVFAQWGAHVLAAYLPGYGEGVHLRLTPDLRILGFTFVVSAVTGLLIGLLPAWRISRTNLATAIKGAATPLGPDSGQSWNKAIAISQLALSCCLLAGAGLLVRTVQSLMALDVGFNRENLVVCQLDLGKGYDESKEAALCREFLRRVENLPGVRSATFSSIQSLGGGESGWGPTKIALEDTGLGPAEGLAVRGTGVGPRYFETMGIPLLLGRDFGPQDQLPLNANQEHRAPRPVIIDHTSARKLFGDRYPVGKLLRASGRETSWPPLQVIGVVGDVIHKNLRSGPRISIYGLETHRAGSLTFFYVRTANNPLTALRGIRPLVRELDPTIAVTGLQTVDELLNKQLAQERTLAELASFFSFSALSLACLGLYGILSYGVVRRTREIGVRMALGAQARDVLLLVLRQGMALTLVGCALGVGLALILTRLITALLYGITATDLPAFAFAIGLLGAIALLACWIPARRAARIDPMEALRHE